MGGKTEILEMNGMFYKELLYHARLMSRFSRKSVLLKLAAEEIIRN